MAVVKCGSHRRGLSQDISEEMGDNSEETGRGRGEGLRLRRGRSGCRRVFIRRKDLLRHWENVG